MTLKIDNAGRIIVPKPLRERLGFRAGMELEVDESAEGLMLKPVAHRPSLVREGRFLVHTGKLAPGSDILKAIDDDREDQMRKLAGL